MRGFKRSVIKEELLMLTGDYKLAIMLNQMIYWSQCVRDFDKFISEEKKRNEDSELELTHGWFYKTANELAQGTLTAMAPSSIRRYLKKLLEAGWVEERSNPKMKWDRTKQYRVNLIQIQQDLNRIGLYLEGYKIEIPLAPEELDLVEQPQTTMDETPEPNEQTSFLEEDQAPEEPAPPEPAPEKIPYSEIIAYLNDSTGKQFQATAVKTRDLIKARWRAHPNQDHFEKVIDTKTDQWLNDPTMNKFLRPDTLFGPKFESYLNEGGTPTETDFEKYLKELE